MGFENKIMCIVAKKLNVRWVALQEFENKYIIIITFNEC